MTPDPPNKHLGVPVGGGAPTIDVARASLVTFGPDLGPSGPRTMAVRHLQGLCVTGEGRGSSAKHAP